jgi:serine/threonine protein kinase
MKDEGYTEKADVWSFGMVLYELTTNTIPYSDCNNPMQIKDKLENKKTPSIPNENEIDSTLRELMKQCWNWDPQQRPSFTQIVQILKKAKSQQR